MILWKGGKFTIETHSNGVVIGCGGEWYYMSREEVMKLRTLLRLAIRGKDAT